MEITFDKSIDALYIKFLRGQVTTERLTDDIAVDYAEGHQVAGFEILNASKNMKNIDRIFAEIKIGDHFFHKV